MDECCGNTVPLGTVEMVGDGTTGDECFLDARNEPWLRRDELLIMCAPPKHKCCANDV